MLDVAGDRIELPTRIFSPHIVPRLCVTIGHQVYEFKRLTALCSFRSELDAPGINGDGVKGPRAQDGHWDHPLLLGLNNVRPSLALDHSI